MKKMLVIICICLLVILGLCSCNKQAEVKTQTTQTDSGQKVVEETRNADGTYQLTYIYLIKSGQYVTLNCTELSHNVKTGERWYGIEICNTPQRTGVQCIDLIQYNNYIKVRLAGYYSKYSDGRYYQNSNGELIVKTLIMSNDQVSYEITK